jgi:SAM dependent carboxyl methyltransferase
VTGTHVMHGAGFYNRHSVQQEEAAAAAVEMFRRAARARAQPDDDIPTVIADYGASQGKNSMHPIAEAIDALDVRDRPVLVVHTDLPDNDFASLFTTVASDPDSYRRAGVFTYAVGRSFYEQLFPPATVTLGWSATAAVWLSATPCPLPSHLFSYASSGPERATWKTAATRDWETFLRHRATELRPGGQLVVSLPVAGPGYLDWMYVIEAGAHDAVDDGVITADEYASMVIPTYLSETDDLTTAVSTIADLALEECEVATAADPAYASYREHRDALRYAADAVSLFRAWAEPSLMDGLDASAADPFFARVAARLAAAPTECPWTIGLLRVRRDDDNNPRDRR